MYLGKPRNSTRDAEQHMRLQRHLTSLRTMKHRVRPRSQKPGPLTLGNPRTRTRDPDRIANGGGTRPIGGTSLRTMKCRVRPRSQKPGPLTWGNPRTRTRDPDGIVNRGGTRPARLQRRRTSSRGRVLNTGTSPLHLQKEVGDAFSFLYQWALEQVLAHLNST